MNLLLLPHQLYSTSHLNKKYTIFLWECPHYFSKYKYNKKKIILHRASMKAYYHELISKQYRIKYIDIHSKLDASLPYVMFDPIDKLSLSITNVTMIESPNFFLSKMQYSEYRKKTKHFIFNNFYKWAKKKTNIIPNIKSQDKQNRLKLPKKINVPNTVEMHNKTEKKFIEDATKFVQTYFDDNPGSVNDFIYPITRRACRKWLAEWISKKISKFGSYQDAIHNTQSYLFHSVLSSSINIGLLNPTDIVNEIQKYKNKIPINSYEGFIRQLFWREYQRFCYIHYNFNRKNYFGNKKKLSRKWYNGGLGIEPVDSCIIRGFDTGYLNHIERLMVIGNFMVLYGISPKEGFKWFMEMSCDSYEWVMTQNVLDMVFFVSGGVTMRRPYLSSSNYILKMSNYKKAKWCETWDKLYQDFKKKKKEKLWKYRYFFKGL